MICDMVVQWSALALVKNINILLKFSSPSLVLFSDFFAIFGAGHILPVKVE